MPIDINAILGRFEARVRPVWNAIVQTMEAMGTQIRNRLERANALERATRDYLILDFRENAIVVQIAEQQKGTLRPEQVQPLWPASIRQEWLLPALVIRLREATDAIRDAVARFRVPRPQMFSGENTRFTDIFGQAAMLLRAFAEDYRPVDLLEDTARRAMLVYRQLFGPPSRTSQQGGTPLAGSLAQIPTMLAGMLLLVPAFIGWLDSLARVAAIGLRLMFLDLMTRAQARVYELRALILTGFFKGIRSVAQDFTELLFVVQHILLRNITYYGWFVAMYAWLLGVQIERMEAAIRSTVNLVIEIANMIGAVMNALRRVNLLSHLTIGDLLDVVSGGRAPSWILGELDLIEASTRTSSPRISRTAALLRAVLRLSFAPPPAVTPPTIPPLPDIYRAALAPYRYQLFDLLHGLRDAVVPGMQQVLSGASGMLMDAANAFANAERQATQAGSPAIWRRISESSERIADAAFGAQVRERQAAMGATPDMAEAFDRQVLTAGMGTIQAAIPRYIGGVIDWWRERRRLADTAPTSPHMLARRARLSRVRMRRLTFRAGGFDFSNAESRARLLAILQERMKEKVEEAWHTGELQVAHG